MGLLTDLLKKRSLYSHPAWALSERYFIAAEEMQNPRERAGHYKAAIDILNTMTLEEKSSPEFLFIRGNIYFQLAATEKEIKKLEGAELSRGSHF